MAYKTFDAQAIAGGRCVVAFLESKEVQHRDGWGFVHKRIEPTGKSITRSPEEKYGRFDAIVDSYMGNVFQKFVVLSTANQNEYMFLDLKTNGYLGFSGLSGDSYNGSYFQHVYAFVNVSQTTNDSLFCRRWKCEIVEDSTTNEQFVKLVPSPTQEFINSISSAYAHFDLTSDFEMTSSLVGYPLAANKLCIEASDLSSKTSAMSPILFALDESNNIVDYDAEVPDFVEPSYIFSRDDYGAVTVQGLQFRSTSVNMNVYPFCQLRYRESGTDQWSIDWDADDASVSIAPTADPNVYTILFSDTYTLTSSDVKHDLEFEVRTATYPYTDHPIPFVSQASSCAVHVLVNPGLSLTSCTFVIDPGKDSAGIVSNVELVGTVSSAQYIKMRIIGEDGDAISDYVTSTSMTISHNVEDNVLYRLPVDGEELTLQYMIITAEGETVNGELDTTFAYSSTFDPPTLEYTEDGSDSVIVKGIKHSTDFCYLMVKNYEQKIKMVRCPVLYSGPNVGDVIQWKALPCLNRISEIVVASKSGNNSGYSFVNAFVPSHNFIWNWARFKSNEPYDEFAIVIVNSDNPPQQTRSFKTDAQFISPVGRTFPVSFATKSIDTSLNIEGVIIDEDANYYAPTPLPEHSTIEYVSKLVRLSGQGIHPIYRTPYGDWYQVAIEQVDISKTDLNKSKVSVNQRAVED